MSDVYAVIMAGGRGERFWPLSTDQLPKPFIPLLGTQSLIRQTVDRLRPLIPPERILISLGEMHRKTAGEQLPEIPGENFIVEPVGRDTAPCIGFCALHIERRAPDATMLAVPADHYVADPEAYRRTLEKGIRALPGAAGVVFGIAPTRPETGYGYIEAQAGPPADGALPVIRFVEKPDMSRALEYMTRGGYFWNSGIFLWSNRTLLTLLRQHMPELSSGLEAIKPLIGPSGDKNRLRAIFETLPRISIDFGIMEKTSGLRLVPAEFVWDDIGNWSALARALPHDDRGNASLGPFKAVSSSGCISYSDAGTIAVFGLSNLIVVQAHGKVLVCPKDRASDLKQLITQIQS